MMFGLVGAAVIEAVAIISQPLAIIGQTNPRAGDCGRALRFRVMVLLLAQRITNSQRFNILIQAWNMGRGDGVERRRAKNNLKIDCLF
jgi:hypothetical protein